MTEAERIAIHEIVDQNKDLPDSSSCHHLSCANVGCDCCPMNYCVTLGEVRKEDDRVEPPKPVNKSADVGVKQPSHYQLFEGVEAIEVIARSMTKEMFKGYCLGNVLKYRLRAGKKAELANTEKDLAKAAFYNELYADHWALCYDTE